MSWRGSNLLKVNQVPEEKRLLESSPLTMQIDEWCCQDQGLKASSGQEEPSLLDNQNLLTAFSGAMDTLREAD